MRSNQDIFGSSSCHCPYRQLPAAMKLHGKGCLVGGAVPFKQGLYIKLQEVLELCDSHSAFPFLPLDC